MVCATVVRMKDAQYGFGETGYAWARKIALVAGVALGLMVTAYGMPVAAADSQAAAQRTVIPPDAATIERQWVAANRAYDEARKTVLTQVQKTAWQGPMQPEWQSLTAYRTPEWYPRHIYGSPMVFIWICRHSRRACMPTPIASAWMDADKRTVLVWEAGESDGDGIANGWHGERSIKPSRSFVTGRKA